MTPLLPVEEALSRVLASVNPVGETLSVALMEFFLVPFVTWLHSQCVCRVLSFHHLLKNGLNLQTGLFTIL